MPDSPQVEIAVRIPGTWDHPRELIERLPDGCRSNGETLVLPDGAEFGFGAAPADEQFAEIFRSSCRQDPSAEELERVQNYKVNLFLAGPGGSLGAARMMMRAAAVLIEAGGAGVFIDNSCLAHGAQHWLEMTDDASSDAVSFAFVSIVRGKSDVWTMGMHALGLHDIIMKRTDSEEGGFDIVEVIRYLARGDKPVGDGHILADLSGPRLRATAQPGPAELSRGPMHNPLGRLKLVNMKEITETN